MIVEGWRYSAPDFRERFPEWYWDAKAQAWCLLVECATLIDDRWEGFVSHVDAHERNSKMQLMRDVNSRPASRR